MENGNLQNRKRQVNVENLSDEQLARLEEAISTKIRKIIDKACDDTNAILQIYGLKALMCIEFKKLNEGK